MRGPSAAIQHSAGKSVGAKNASENKIPAQ